MCYNNRHLKGDCMKNKLKINTFIHYIILIMYLEIITKYIFNFKIISIETIYILIFTLPIILLLTIITKIFNKKINKVLVLITTLILIIYFEVQLIFYKLFSVPFSFSTIGLANQATDFVNIIIDAIKSNIIPFILILLPLIILIIFNNKIDTNKYNKYQIITLIIMLLTSYLSTFIYLEINTNNKKLYFNTDNASEIIKEFGLINYTKIDIKRELIGYKQILINDDIESSIEEDNKEYGSNILNINFNNTNNSTINDLNNYFSTKQPSNKNEYTGMFKGKNLIFILAEGFNEIAVDENRTPTLYKLINNGFNFTNFYSPVFLSTTGGEFQATTGLIPTQETLKIWKSKQPTISYALGNAFSNIGYRTQSYHDWTYTYYKRNVTMNTLGFNNYLGCGNGLENEMDCKWLPKDSDMINATTPKYLNGEGNFVTYYVTVSGHSPYNSSDNIGSLYLDNVDTSYSEPVRYYLAAQMELDKAVEQLINNLEETGELDDTVIALVGDHYPYTLSTEQVNEVSSYQKDGTIEINRSNFILWNNKMKEPIKIEKVGSQIDVLPTILNLFGIDYDSRLIIGKDILSDYEGIAIFSNRSWVTDYGWYYANEKKFILKEGKTLDDEQSYINKMNNRVSNAYSISKMIIDTDYYNYILKQ